MRRTNLCFFMFIAVAGCGDDAATLADASSGTDARPTFEPDAGASCPQVAALEAALDAERTRQGISGVEAGLDMPGCTWTGASGLADRPAGREVVATDRFRVGSITKTFTAAVTLQLVEEGALGLDDPIATYVTFPGGDGITIRHLLGHTSGIYNYTDSPAVQMAFDQPWTRQEVLDIAAAQPSGFTPGSEWSYSNTNYFLLGLIIEDVTGHPFHEEVRDRLLTPLALDDTFLEGPETLPGGFVRGYYRQGASFTDITDLIDPSLAWSAGSMVSTVDDLEDWARALFAGDVLDAATRTAMLTPVALPGGTTAPTGLCIFVSDQGALGALYSHGGSIHGFQALFGYLPAHDAAMASLTNDQEGDANAFLIEILEAVSLL